MSHELMRENQSDRAFDYFLEQLYDAQRGYIAAYAIESSQPGALEMVTDLPPWKDLTCEEAWEFISTARPSFGPLIAAVKRVAVMHAQSTDNT